MLSSLLSNILIFCFILIPAAAKYLHLTTPNEFGKYLQDYIVLNNSTNKFVSPKCLEELNIFAADLISSKLWAIEMFDAGGKIPSGLLEGNLGNLGAFDECLNVHNNEEFIYGKYCLGEIELVDLRRKPDRAVQKILDIFEASLGLPWGICLPHSCTAQDFKRLFSFISLEFTEKNCQTKLGSSKEFDSADIGALVFFGLMGAVIMLSTLYDVCIRYRNQEGSLIWCSFSVISNGRKILTNTEGNCEIPCINGIKSLTLIVIIIFCRFGLNLLGPLTNWIDVANFILDNPSLFEIIIIFDTFFVISGMLVSYSYLKFKKNRGRFNILKYYLNGLLRFTPSLAVVILFHATLLRHIGSGPVWLKLRDSLLVDNCRERWWTSLIYIQNYYSPYFIDNCLIQSWQLAINMQLFVLAPLFLIPLYRAPKLSCLVIGVLVICAILSPFLTTYFYNLKSVILSALSIQDLQKFLKYFFSPTHTRASPWFIGLIIGYIIFKTKNEAIKISVPKSVLVITSFLLWMLSFGIMGFTVVIGMLLMKAQYYWLYHALHMSLLRPLWSLAISWMVFACVHGYGGIVNNLLSSPFFQFISKISYSTYLTNITLMFILTYQTRVGIYFGGLQMFHKCCADICLCLLFGFFWTVCFESPFIALSKYLFNKKPKVELEKYQKMGKT